jgi:uncharacterized protein (DUF2141 family)
MTMKRTLQCLLGGWIAAALGYTACALATPPVETHSETNGETPIVFLEPTDGHALTVTVTDAKTQDGQLLIALFTKEEGFPADVSKAVKTATVAIDKPSHTFEKLPAGKYVVVVVHDRNKNGKVDKSLLGPPKEPIGLSNHPKISPPNHMPNFEKAKVEVTQATKIEIKLIELGL